jgi:hypothetical protein
MQGDPFALAFMPCIIFGQDRSALKMITKLFLGIRTEGLLIPGEVIVHEGGGGEAGRSFMTVFLPAPVAQALP